MSRVSNIKTSRIRNYIDFNKDVLSFLSRMVKEGEVVSLRTGFKPSYIVNSPDFIQEILVNKDSFFRKGRTTAVLKWTIGEGLLTSENKEHDRQKKYLQPVFYKERLLGYAQTVVKETNELVNQLRSQTIISLQDETMQLTLSIIAKTMFATELKTTKKKLADAVSDTIEQTASVLFSPFLLPLSFPSKGHRIHKRAIKTLEDMIFNVIEKAKENRELYKNTLLGLLLDTKYESGDPVTDQEIRDQMMTMLLAGHETSANLLNWIFYLLDRNREIEQKFHQEIDQINDIEQSPFDVYRGLEYTQNIIQEALRLYPPAWLIYREANKDVDLLGETFKSGSTFMLSPYAIHRNEEVFPEPNRFIPERFAKGMTNSIPKFSYFPFGGGSRSCIGTKFALMETALILAVLGKNYSFRCLDQAPAIPEPLVSLRIKGGLKMNIIPR